MPFIYKKIKMTQQEKYIQETIKLAIKSIQNKGGPFGAIIVKDGKIVGKGTNKVTKNLDPTAHAEIQAIRQACKKLKTFNLENCEIYTSCEPCPMCLSAIYWAHIKTIYYAQTSKDAQEAEFNDSFIYKELNKPKNKRKIKEIQIPLKTTSPFTIWKNTKNKTKY